MTNTYNSNFILKPITNDHLSLPLLRQHNISADVLRLDQLHPVVSGNKWFKLKDYLHDAHLSKSTGILTFGGAYSNHIVAAAFACSAVGFDVVGIIRGERPASLSHTLLDALAYGMHLEFVSREQYDRKTETDGIEILKKKFPGYYIIPEGGAGELGIRGACEILSTIHADGYTHIMCAIGTGTMFLGIARAISNKQQLIGIPVLKSAELLTQQLSNAVDDDKKQNLHFFHDYHFGGYAKKTRELLTFMNEFFRETTVPTDFVYTAKLMFSFSDLVSKQYFPTGSKILLIHSGGLQGNDSLPAGTLAY